MDKGKIRVLVVDDFPETRENIRKLLQFESDVEVVGTARTGKEGLQLAGELEPDVVLMDINMPDMDGIQATEAIRQKVAWVQIVILSVQGDSNYMRRAMLAGARDFLTKPPKIDDLIATIRRAGVMAEEEKKKDRRKQAREDLFSDGTEAVRGQRGGRGKIVTLYSPKGGVGCSTIAVNLSVALQNDDSQVLIVDGNLAFGGVAIFFNEQGKNHVGDLAPRVNELDPEIVEEVVITHEASGVKILAAPPKPEFADEITGDQFGKLLGFLRQIYQYIIVDTASALSDITLAALDAADLLILVTTQEIPSIANAKLFLDLTNVLGLRRDSIHFLMNRYDKRINITPERVSENLKKSVDGIIPLDSRTVIPAVNRGIPFMLDPRTKAQPAGRAILTLAQTVRARVIQSEQAAAQIT